MTYKLNLELRNITHSERLSEETNCYTADLYLDGKKIAHVGNRGRGGPDEVHPVPGGTVTMQQLWDLDAKIKATYPKEEVYGMELEQSLETICGDLLTRWLVLRDLRRRMKSALCFVPQGENIVNGMRSIKFRNVRKLTPAHIKIARETVATSYKGAVILNDLDEAALAVAAAPLMEA